MSLKKSTYILFFFWVFNMPAQNMQEGFNYLETGAYTEAETFFKTILTLYPDNKTARLCYGRAVGLNGNPLQASQLFASLLEEYPNDFEIRLNYGEALLWNKRFLEAKKYFGQLIIENPTNFPALLSYANTLSNLQAYQEALLYIDKALALEPNNPGALNSKKYIYLGYAYQKQQAQAYKEAEALLKENLSLYTNDKETLLNLANLYLIMDQLENAKATYSTLAENTKHTIVAHNGLALVAHLQGKNKKALEIATKAFQQMESITNLKEQQQTIERYIQTLIWNKHYKKATTLISEQIDKNPNQNWVLALRATLQTYKGDFTKSLKDYNKILENDPSSFDGNLGKANTLKALGLYKETYLAADKIDSIFKNQKDVVQFKKTLNKQFTPYIQTKTGYSEDNGNNEAITLAANLVFPVTTKLQLNGGYTFRDAKNTLTNTTATANTFTVGARYMMLPKITLNTRLGMTSVRATENEYTQFLTDVSVNIESLKKQSLDIGFKREWQDFNADLLNREIVQNTLYTNYNLSTHVNLGWFTQYNYTWQNDNNARHLLFTSLYYNLLDQPLLKTGINYQYITFKDQVPTIYFSPDQFNVVEVFAEILRNQKGKWMYHLNAATGYQFIEEEEGQATYRLQGKLGYTFSNRFNANIYGLHSNIASTTAAGFTFSEIGFQLRWDLLEQPVFRE